MARKPTPGSDDGTWGDILNSYLDVAHNIDGTLKNGVVGLSNLSAGSPTSGQVLSTDGTALTWSTVSGSGTVPDANSSTKGLVQLTGDLGGTAASPTVPGLSSKAAASDLTSHTSNTSNPHSVTKAQVGLGNVDNTSDTNKPVSSATQTALNLKANLASPTFTGTVTVPTPTNNSDAATKAYVDTAAGSKLSNITGFVTPGTNITLSGSGTSASPYQISASGGGAVSDATTSAKGIVQLTGDLGGTAASPTVPGLAAKAADTTVVHNTGTETVAGVKTFSSSPIVPTPTTSTQAANKSYVDGAVSAGSGGRNAVAKSANYTAAAGDFVVGDASSAAFTVTLPSPSNGAQVSVKKVDSSVNGILIAPPSGQIDGSSTVVVNNQWQSQDFLSDGTKWYLI